MPLDRLSALRCNARPGVGHGDAQVLPDELAAMVISAPLPEAKPHI
jgi:hypothetical protein